MGQTTLDIQFLLNTYPQQNKVTHSAERLLEIGGPATNASIVFSYLGGDSTLVTPLGKSFFSEWMRNKLKEYKVNHIDTNPNHEEVLSISTILTTESDGNRTIITKNYSNINHTIDIDSYDFSNISIILIDLTNINLALKLSEFGKKIIYQ